MKPRKEIWRLFALPQRVIQPKRMCIDCVNDTDHTHCYVCDAPLFFKRGPGWHISHLQASALKGPDDDYNLRICCSGCNLHMGTMTPYAYAQELELTSKNSLAMCERINNKYDAAMVYELIYTQWFGKYCSVIQERDGAFAKAASFEIENREKMRLEGGNVVGEREPNEDKVTSLSSSSSVSSSSSSSVSSSSFSIPLPVAVGPCIVRTFPGTVFPPIPSTQPFVPKSALTKTTVLKNGSGKISKLTKPQRDYIQADIERYLYAFFKEGTIGEYIETLKIECKPHLRLLDGEFICNRYTVDTSDISSGYESKLYEAEKKDNYEGLENFFHEVLFHWCMNNDVTYTKLGSKNHNREDTASFSLRYRPRHYLSIPLDPYPFVVKMRSNPETIYVDGPVDSFLAHPDYISHEVYYGERDDIIRHIEYYKKEVPASLTEYVRHFGKADGYRLDKALTDYWVAEKGATFAFLSGAKKFVYFFDTKEHFVHNPLLHSVEEFELLRKKDRDISNEVYHAEGCFLIRVDYTFDWCPDMSDAVSEIKKTGAKYYFSTPEMYSYLFTVKPPSSEETSA